MRQNCIKIGREEYNIPVPFVTVTGESSSDSVVFKANGALLWIGETAADGVVDISIKGKKDGKSKIDIYIPAQLPVKDEHEVTSSSGSIT